jgi:hypothetical protein
MKAMETQAIERLKEFNTAMVLPIFEEIKFILELNHHKVFIAEALPTPEETFDELLKTINSTYSAPFLADYHADMVQTQTRWVLAALMVQLSDVPSSIKRPYDGKYCLAIESVIQEDGQIYATAELCYLTRDHVNFSGFSHPLESSGVAYQDIENLSQLDLLTYFIDSFGAFKFQWLREKPEVYDPPIAEMVFICEQQNPTAMVAHQASAHPESVLEPPVVLPEPVDSALEKKAALAKEIEAQHQATRAFLLPFQLPGLRFQDISNLELAHVWELVSQINGQRPQQAGDYQIAYDWLGQQASEFALSLKPTSAAEFSDYVALYRAMIENDCTFALERTPETSHEAIFVSQVKALGEAEAPHKAKASVCQQLRLLFRDIAVKFGRPDAIGQREWIGNSHINPRQTNEQQIQMIQMLNDQRQLRFNSLSWGVLQICRNAVFQPQSEQQLGRNLVHRYLRSLQLTVKQPSAAVESQPLSDGGVEFCFSRNVFEGSKCWRASVRVKVTHFYDEVVLRSYSFEAL